jgi:hypothetical protein
MAAPYHNPWLLAAFISRDSSDRPNHLPAPDGPFDRPGRATDRCIDRPVEPSPRRRWGELAFVGCCAAAFLFVAGGAAYGVLSLFT